MLSYALKLIEKTVESRRHDSLVENCDTVALTLTWDREEVYGERRKREDPTAQRDTMYRAGHVLGTERNTPVRGSETEREKDLLSRHVYQISFGRSGRS